MRKVLAGLGTLALGLTLAATSALAQSQTYPMGISSPAFGPGVSGATPPAEATANPPSRSATTSRRSRASANSSLASAPSERSDVSQTYPMGISSPAFGPGVSGGGAR
jgi:hypothetical protein